MNAKTDDYHPKSRPERSFLAPDRDTCRFLPLSWLYQESLPMAPFKIVAEGDEANLERFINALAVKEPEINININTTNVEKIYSSAT